MIDITVSLSNKSLWLCERDSNTFELGQIDDKVSITENTLRREFLDVKKIREITDPVKLDKYILLHQRVCIHEY